MKLLCTKSDGVDFKEGKEYVVISICSDYKMFSYTVIDEEGDERIVPLKGFLWNFDMIEGG